MLLCIIRDKRQWFFSSLIMCRQICVGRCWQALSHTYRICLFIYIIRSIWIVEFQQSIPSCTWNFSYVHVSYHLLFLTCLDFQNAFWVAFCYYRRTVPASVAKTVVRAHSEIQLLQPDIAYCGTTKSEKRNSNLEWFPCFISSQQS
jgi:hypothetical protein